MEHRSNNFDTLRALAAFAVLLSHSFPLTGLSEAEPVFRLSRQQTTAGTIAVDIFFVISGYLITESFVRTRNPRRFAVNRALRLLPGLAVVVAFLSFVLGPIITTIPVSSYFDSWPTYRFPLVNLSLLRFADGLPGVFTGLPFANAVDGSLWTLHYEVNCYILVFVLGTLGVLNRYSIALLFVAGFVSVLEWKGGYTVGLGTLFVAGACIYFWQPPLKGAWAFTCAAIWFLSLLTKGLRLASATAGAYLVIYLALGPSVRLPRLARWGDFSYGIYIWAFPVQQSVNWLLGPNTIWWKDALLSAPVVLVLAALSWHFVEAPALALKRRFRGVPDGATALGVTGRRL